LTKISLHNNCFVLDRIPYAPDVPALRKRLSFYGNFHLVTEVLPELLNRAAPLIRPRAVYKVSRVSGKTRDAVEIDGVRFASMLLRVNLGQAEKVFPYAVSSVGELDLLQIPENDASRRLCLKIILDSLLETAVKYLRDYLTRLYALDYLWSIDPGDFQAWPTSQRKPLFSLLNCLEEKIGVSLVANYDFIPSASRAGFFYYAETVFEACQLCSREPCMGRRAPFNPELAQKGHLKVSSSCSRITGPR